MKLEEIADDWVKAQILLLQPSWEGIPKATWNVERIVAKWPEFREAVLGLLRDPRPVVVAYALATARMAKDPILLKLDEGLLTSRAGITVQEGSFRTSTQLGDLARKWAKEARIAHGVKTNRDLPN
jgi:hypothetical protein